MTALCGALAAVPDDRRERLCRELIGGLSRYGHHPPRIRTLGEASFALSLFDLTPEDREDRQPISNGYLLVADIRIDNREDLLAALPGGTSIRGAADSTILAGAIDRWGLCALDRVIGDFAVAIYQSGPRQLHLARSPAGQRPLFFREKDGVVAFASMPSALLALGRADFDLDALTMILGDLEPDAESSGLAGIRRVPPGTILSFGPSRQRRSIWPASSPQELRTLEQHVAGYRDLLDRAVRSRLRRVSGPAATHLSSGYDSNAVAATAARIEGEACPLVAFTSAPAPGFAGPMPRNRIADESPLAALTARRYGMDHQVIRNPGSWVEGLRSQARDYQNPSRNIVNSAWLRSIEQAAAARGATILLSGDLGNLTLNTGGLWALGDVVRDRGIGSWWREARAAARSGDVRWRGILFNSFGRYLPLSVFHLILDRGLGVRDRGAASFLNRDRLDTLRAGANRYDRRLQLDPADYRRQVLEAMDYGTTRKGALAESGIDVRDPTSDRRVMDFSLALPPEMMFADGVSRPLARAALADRVPAEILQSKVRGTQAADWCEVNHPAAIRAAVEEIAASPTVRALIDIPALIEAVDRWPRSDLGQFEIYDRYAGYLPATIATGMFILEMERIRPGSL